MSILDLEEVADETVSGERHAEVSLRFLDVFAVIHTEEMMKISDLLETFMDSLLQTVKCDRVLEHLHHTTVWTDRYHLVWTQLKRQAFSAEDLIELVNQLHC